MGRRLRLVAAVFAELAAFWPVWTWYARRLFHPGEERMGLLALVTAVYFLLTGRGAVGAGREERRSLFLHRALAISLGLAYAAAYHFVPPLPRAALAIGALGVSLGGRTVEAGRTAGIVGLLLLSLQIVPSLQFFAGYPLRVVSAEGARLLLGLSGFAVERRGTFLGWDGTLIGVDAPCSGVKMLWAGGYLVFALACRRQLDARRTILAAASTLPVLVFANALRASALFFTESGLLNAPAFVHSGVGLASFAAAAGVIAWWTGRLAGMSR